MPKREVTVLTACRSSAPSHHLARLEAQLNASLQRGHRLFALHVSTASNVGDQASRPSLYFPLLKEHTIVLDIGPSRSHSASTSQLMAVNLSSGSTLVTLCPLRGMAL